MARAGMDVHAPSIFIPVKELVASTREDAVWDQILDEIRLDYPGYAVTTIACLDRTRTTITMDLGIGDQVIPEKRSLALLALNNQPLFESEISSQVYPLSYIFAEKLEAIVYRGGTNSRMKDFYALIVLSQFPEFSSRAAQF